MSTQQRLPELHMKLKNRKRLLTLMTIQDVSQRRLAIAAGYRSHAYLGRLLRGEVSTLDPDAALRIANFLRVGVDDLFVTRVSSATEHSVRHGAAVRSKAGAA